MGDRSYLDGRKDGSRARKGEKGRVRRLLTGLWGPTGHLRGHAVTRTRSPARVSLRHALALNCGEWMARRVRIGVPGHLESRETRETGRRAEAEDSRRVRWLSILPSAPIDPCRPGECIETGEPGLLLNICANDLTRVQRALCE